MALNVDAVDNPLTLDQERELIQNIWPRLQNSPLPNEDVKGWRAYFQHYVAEIKSAIESDGGANTTVRTHQDIVAICRDLDKGISKQEIKQKLFRLDTKGRSDAEKEKMAEGSVNLVVRLLFMIDIGHIAGNHIPSHPYVQWTDDKLNIGTVLEAHFQKSKEDAGKIKFDSKFSAYNLERLAGIKIVWTNNIADHLRLVEDDSKLCVFHHTTFLKWQDR
jgi:hypothetical protein